MQLSHWGILTSVVQLNSLYVFSLFVQRVFPYISAMVGNGSLVYDHDQDGRNADLGGCSASIRNIDYDTFLLVRYIRNTLTVRTHGQAKTAHDYRSSLGGGVTDI